MNYVRLLEKFFIGHANKENAFHMEKYMRNQFQFFGIRTPIRRKLTRQFLQENPLLKKNFNTEFVRALWASNQREYQYVGVDYIASSLAKLEKTDILLMEDLITTKPWWDTVDMLAQKPVGTIAKKYSQTIQERIERWAHSNNLWLQRSAILFQLKYKEDTDEDLLYHYIKMHSDSNEFFIQKAIGWALREYSKTNPNSVHRFIENNQLSKLSVREGRKYLN